jgi:predicted PurR-regulated permease PerM
MYSTSIDVMYGVISLAIAIFTGFLVWIMYYVAQILKQGNEVIAEVREKIEEFEESVNMIRDKVMSSASAISFIASEVGSVVDFVKDRSERKSTRRSRR